MTWTITTTTTISASRAVTLAERIPSEPIKFVVLHPGTGAGGTVTIWDDLGRSVASTRIGSLSSRHEAEFFSDRSIFNVSAAIDGNATLSGAGVSVCLVSREAPEPSIAGGSTSFAGALQVGGAISTPSAGKGVWGWKIVGGSNYAGAADDQTASTISTSRRVYRNEGGKAITRIALVYANAIPNGTSASETDLSGLGDVTASAYFENADGTTQLPIADAATAVIKPGRVMITDPMDVYIAPGERFWARSVVSKLSAVKIPVTGLNYQAYEGVALGSNIGANTGMTGFTSSTGSGVWAPVAVIGWTDGDYVEFIGDSITKGTGDSAGPLVPTGLQGVTGWVRRWLYGKANYIVAGYPGGSSSQWNNALNCPSLRGWLARITPPTTMIIAFGANDLMPNPTLAAMQAAYTRAVAEARARGVLRVGIAEILPRTITSDSWATQSPASASFAAGGLRDQLNTWFHSSGLFDFVLPTNSAVATGAVWTNPGASGDTSDGCHPLTAGAIKIAASMPDVSEIFA